MDGREGCGVQVGFLEKGYLVWKGGVSAAEPSAIHQAQKERTSGGREVQPEPAGVWQCQQLCVTGVSGETQVSRHLGSVSRWEGGVCTV